MDARRREGFGAEAPPLSHSAAPASKAGAGPSKSKRPGKKTLLGAALLALCAGSVDYGWRYWTVGRFEISTDDAYLDADKVTISPRIAGYVAEARVSDYQKVRAGDLIAVLDDREYRVLVKAANAEMEKDRADLLGVSAAIAGQQAQIQSAKADLANAHAALTFSQQEFSRYQNLVRTGAGSVQRQQQAASDLLQRRAAVEKSQAALAVAQKQIDSLTASQAGARAVLDEAAAKADQAKLNLEYTRIVAPIDGVVGDSSLRIGQFVPAGTNLLTLVPMGRQIFLVANFKETQTAFMKTGQPVGFTLDAFGSREFRGKVESFAPGTGAQFALLPPENATGNFTKIVQRVPVRIAIDPSDPLVGRIRPGLSADATVYTHSDDAEKASRP